MGGAQPNSPAPYNRLCTINRSCLRYSLAYSLLTGYFKKPEFVEASSVKVQGRRSGTLSAVGIIALLVQQVVLGRFVRVG